MMIPVPEAVRMLQSRYWVVSVVARTVAIVPLAVRLTVSTCTTYPLCAPAHAAVPTRDITATAATAELRFMCFLRVRVQRGAVCRQAPPEELAAPARKLGPARHGLVR